MKKYLALIPLALLLTGCGTLIPKSVEFFQKKVKAVPEVTAKAEETRRQAADYVSTKTEEAKIAAIAANSGTNIVTPITESHIVAEALSGSLGPPEDPWKKEAQRLALLLKEQQANYNERLASYAARTEKLEGKKIEGTGLIRVPYFVYIGCIVLVVFLAWTALKIYGSINPLVGIGTSTAGRIGSSLLSRGFSEVVEAGEQFKNYVADSGLTDAVREQVLDLFQRAHKEHQSRDVQGLVKTITK